MGLQLEVPRGDMCKTYLALSITPQSGSLFGPSSVPLLPFFRDFPKALTPTKKHLHRSLFYFFSIQMLQMYFCAIKFICDAFLFYTGYIHTLYYKCLHYEVSVTRTNFPITSRENTIQKSKPRADLN